MIGEFPSSRTRIRVAKVNGGHDAELVLRSSDAFCFRVHWLGARSYMCPGEECPACEQSIGSKWVGMIAVDVLLRSGAEPLFRLLELTESAYECLRFLRVAEGLADLVGLRVHVTRRFNKSPLHFELAELVEAGTEPRDVVPLRFVADAAATLYGLPNLGPEETVEAWEPRAKLAAASLIGRVLSSRSE